MIGRILTLLALTLLAGCVSQKQTDAPVPGTRPAGFIALLEDKTGGTYVDFRTISAYQGNAHLRHFYTVNNYLPPTHIQKNPSVWIASSRVINVVNCDTKERALFERIYLSEYWGRGEAIAKRKPVGQWEAFPENSLFGIIAKSVCLIKAEALKPEPAAESRKMLLGDI